MCTRRRCAPGRCFIRDMPRLNIRRVKGGGQRQAQSKKKKTALLQDVDPYEVLLAVAGARERGSGWGRCGGGAGR